MDFGKYNNEHTIYDKSIEGVYIHHYKTGGSVR